MKLSNALKTAATIAVIGALTLGLAPTFAATPVTTTFAVNATVNSICTIAASPLAFGTYAFVQNNATTTISVQCTNTTPYTVGLDQGKTSGATVTTRQMVNGTTTPNLNYSLFSDTLRSVNWGNTTGSWVSGTGSGAVQTLTVYGQIPANQYVTPGTFSDTITATLTY